MYHKVIAVGRLGRDPEMRYTPQGHPVCNFSVATDVGWGDNKTTVWFRVTAWRKLAETCNQYLKKGRQVLVEGELSEPKPYQGRDNEWRASLNLTAREVRFLGSREDAVNSGEPERGDEAANRPPAVNELEELSEEEMPF